MPGFLAPLFLFGALAAAVPIVLHLLRREPEAKVKFAAVRLLELAPVEQAARRRLREWLLLALRVSALVLLSLAFARPYLAGSTRPASGEVTIVALDTSFSLSSPDRFERARELARGAVRRAPTDGLVALVTFSDTARVVVAPTSDERRVIAAIDGAEAGFGGTNYRQALAVAAGLVEEHGAGAGAIVVVTDAQQSGWKADDRVVVPEPARVELVDVGPIGPNLAVTNVEKAAGALVRVTVRNLGPDARDAQVKLVVDGAEAAAGSVALGPGQTGHLELPVGDGGTVAEVHVDDPNGLQPDNVRYAVLDAQLATPVLVVAANGDLEREAFYVQQALLASGPSGVVHAVEGVGADVLSGWPAARLESYSAVILLSTRGLERRGRDLVREFSLGGGRLLVAAGPGVDGDVVGGVLGRGVTMTPGAADRRYALTPVDVRHPVFRALRRAGGTLGLAEFRQVVSVTADDCDLLARFTGGEAALIECGSGTGRTLVFASDLNHAWNDLPRHATFVPFLHEIVAYLSEGRTSVAEYEVGEVPEGLQPVPGIANVPASLGVMRPGRVAVNVAAEESEPARLTADEFFASVSRAPASPEAASVAARPEGDHGAWRYLLLLMIGVLVVESVIGRRTA